VNRFRYRLKLKYPMNEHWFLQAFNELFINFNDQIFNQNRLFVALGYNLNNQIAIQAGYMKLHFPGLNYDRLQLVVTINADFSNNNGN